MVEKHAIFMFSQGPDDHDVAASADDTNHAESHQEQIRDNDTENNRQYAEEKRRRDRAPEITFYRKRLAAVSIGRDEFYIKSEIDTVPLLFTGEMPEESVDKLVNKDRDQIHRRKKHEPPRNCKSE